MTTNHIAPLISRLATCETSLIEMMFFMTRRKNSKAQGREKVLIMQAYTEVLTERLGAEAFAKLATRKF